MNTERDLRAVSELALQIANAEENLERLIRDLHKEGASLRVLANAAAMSHETIRRIVSR